jgi:hypothetical protein
MVEAADISGLKFVLYWFGVLVLEKAGRHVHLVFCEEAGIPHVGIRAIVPMLQGTFCRNTHDFHASALPGMHVATFCPMSILSQNLHCGSISMQQSSYLTITSFEIYVIES